MENWILACSREGGGDIQTGIALCTVYCLAPREYNFDAVQSNRKSGKYITKCWLAAWLPGSVSVTRYRTTAHPAILYINRWKGHNRDTVLWVEAWIKGRKFELIRNNFGLLNKVRNMVGRVCLGRVNGSFTSTPSKCCPTTLLILVWLM